MKQLALLFGLLVTIILLASWLTKNSGSLLKTNITPSLPQVKIGEKVIPVEIADTNDKRQKGLSGRNSLGENQGMLFALEQNSIPAFWMKDMKFAIDMIWIDDGKVVDITKNVPVPAPKTKTEELIRYRPQQPVDYVLEVNAGWVDQNNLQTGIAVELPAQLD
ncbi:DUF192 domain-containing protein [Candidatus Microgenomates bacterium]|nr:DUF192 domain-containing protein [Candidatus Microgenomates bacterium]